MRKLFLLALIAFVLIASGCCNEEHGTRMGGPCEEAEQGEGYLCIQGRIENVKYTRIPMYMFAEPQYLMIPQWQQKVTIAHIDGRRLIIFGDLRLNVDEIVRLRLSRTMFIYTTGQYPEEDIWDRVIFAEVWSQKKEVFRHRVHWNI